MTARAAVSAAAAAGSVSAATAAGAPRDAQRGRVYDAENLVLRMLDHAAQVPIVHVAGSSITLPVERRFASVESVQDYIDAVLALRWVRQRWPAAAEPVRVRRRNGSGRAHYERHPTRTSGSAVIAVPGHVAGVAWALRELVVLHELAHHLTDPAAASHGPEFVSVLLELVDGIVGPEAAFLLRMCLLDAGARLG